MCITSIEINAENTKGILKWLKDSVSLNAVYTN